MLRLDLWKSEGRNNQPASESFRRLRLTARGLTVQGDLPLQFYALERGPADVGHDKIDKRP
jgi:hypothetical protein